MKIAIPLLNEKMPLHAGHAPRFALVNVDPVKKKILSREDLDTPPHQPGLLPHWLAEHGVTVIITTGLGRSAVQLFTELGIQVVLGAAMDSPENLVDAYLKNLSH
jgi:predicted Fe-Mo cluster-binding NifX family protein